MSKTAEQVAQLIWERAKPLFKKMYGVQYYIEVVNPPYDEGINFFFETVPTSNKTHVKRRSTPLHSLKEKDLEQLESIIQEIKKLTQISIRYQGFIGQLWPSAGNPIAKVNVSDQEAAW